MFNIRFNSIKYKVPVHRLVAYQKFGDRIFEKGIEVRHLNGESYCNVYDNIGIGTHSENLLDIPKEKRQYYAKWANKKHSDELIAKIRKDHSEGLSYKYLTLKYGLSKSTLSYYLTKNGKSKQIEF